MAMQLVGVNLASAEFAPQNDPGTYNVDYTYPTAAEIDYYLLRGMTVFRLPFLMDRMQNVANGPLNQAQLGYMDQVVKYATSKGAKVILDPHDYGYEHGTLIADGPSDAAFANFWGQLAAHYSANPNVIFGLENEPHTQTADQWLPAVNAAIAAIRNTGATQEILVPGISWESGERFTSDGSSTTLAAGIKDPAHNFAFEVHQYLDADGSGSTTNIANGDVAIGAERLQAVTQWATQTGSKLFLGEIGVGPDATSTTALGNTLAYLQQNSGVWQGVTYFAGGPWWGNTPFSIEPTGLGTANVVDKPQMLVLKKFVPGTVSPPAATTPQVSAAAPVTIGSGPDSLALSVSEDAWNGDAQFTVSVDGKQIGGVQTAVASHGKGQSQTFNVLGSFATGSHTTSVNFLNDAYGGSSATDRNLYVTAASIDGVPVPAATLTELSSGPQSFNFLVAGSSGAPGAVVIGSGADTLALQVSEDAYNGDAQFTVSVNGRQIGGTQTATAAHASGQVQTFNVLGSFAPGSSNTVAVNFLNDAYGGTSTTDRNLYVIKASIDGTAIPGAALTELSSGPQSFSFLEPTTGS